MNTTYHAKWQRDNRLHLNAYRHAYYCANKEKVNASNMAWQKRNKVKLAKYRKEWRASRQ